MKKLLSLLLNATLATLCATASAQQAETVWIPMSADAGAPAVKLEATLYRTPNAGPVPVVMFHHGSSGGPIPANYTERAQGLAKFLNARGVALIVPMRAGRGQSEGVDNEQPSACTVAATQAGMRNASAAVDATLQWLRAQPWPDMSRVVMAGHSRGGLLSVAYAAAHPDAVRGSINFSGGWKDDRCGDVDVNAVAFEAAGKAPQRVPSLFLYARGDGFYADASMEKYGRVFEGAGGDVTFRMYAFDDVNGHLLFRRKQALWEADVAAFLARIGLEAGGARQAP
ncbi:dienelactone hydrolase [Pelomonas aquatica]|uniref:Dienelactone hydrolase n=1 Tax=Pelomonas aquatica TaxID=431058 RepID=A0ABU1Z700_9BURK|nr:CocE/NonD family hydrolase [Pelomonas aquatica]MDR7296387.1 dienelactone hydrolase [Pelomonas aquatica]